MPLTARILSTALSSGCSLSSIKNYIQRFTIEEVARTLKHMFKGHRVITYAVETDNVKLVQLLLEYNVDVNLDAHESGNVPLLAFSIMRSDKTGFSNIDMITILLAYGADPMARGGGMIGWQEYLKTPHALVTGTQCNTAAGRWCTQKHHEVLARTLNLTVRYFLWRASRLNRPKKRALQNRR